MLITLVSLVHPSPTPEMKIIIHLHEEPAPAPASEDTAGGSEAGSDYQYHYGTTFPNNGFQPPNFRGPMNPPIRRFPNFGFQPPNYQNPGMELAYVECIVATPTQLHCNINLNRNSLNTHTHT